MDIQLDAPPAPITKIELRLPPYYVDPVKLTPVELTQIQTPVAEFNRKNKGTILEHLDTVLINAHTHNDGTLGALQAQIPNVKQARAAIWTLGKAMEGRDENLSQDSFNNWRRDFDGITGNDQHTKEMALMLANEIADISQKPLSEIRRILEIKRHSRAALVATQRYLDDPQGTKPEEKVEEILWESNRAVDNIKAQTVFNRQVSRHKELPFSFAFSLGPSSDNLVLFQLGILIK